MSANLTLHELTGSPNSVKARIALGYKGLKYDCKAVELSDYPGNRDSVVKLSRQPRLPVLQHGQTVIFDSGAILRFTWKRISPTPRRFSSMTTRSTARSSNGSCAPGPRSVSRSA